MKCWLCRTISDSLGSKFYGLAYGAKNGDSWSLQIILWHKVLSSLSIIKQVLWDGEWIEGSGRSTGEECEQVFSYLSRCSNTTKYQRPESKYKYKIYKFILLRKHYSDPWTFMYVCMGWRFWGWIYAYPETFYVVQVFLIYSI